MVRAPRYEPLFDIHPLTGASIEVFYADRAVETFGRVGAGGSGVIAGAAWRQMGQRLDRFPPAMQRIGTR